MKRLPFAIIFLGLCALACGGERAAAPAKKPNLLIDVSGRLIDAAVRSDVDRTEPVQEVIQDTPVHGIGRTVGAVRTELIPDASRGVVDVLFSGRVDSRTIGTRDHVLIHTFSTTPVAARRRIVFDGWGVRQFPAGSGAVTNTTLLAITGRNGNPDTVASDFARWAFPRSRPAAERETAYKTAGQLSERMGQELSPALDSLRDSARGGFKNVKDAGMSIQALNFSTSPHALHARVRIAAAKSAQPAEAPPLPAGVDLGLRVHQSLINEGARAAYGGRAFPVDKVSGFYDEVIRGFLRDARTSQEQQDSLKIIEKLIADLAGKPTTITLAREDPITVAFVDQGFTIEIHVASITQGETVYAGSRVHGAYKFENAADGVHLVRQGKVVLTPIPVGKDNPDVEAAPASFIALQELLFAEVLKERLVASALPAPAMFSKLQFQPPLAGARDGWFGVAWILAAKK